ncbi:hypothetical protein Pmar_PMAR027390 [Perkinsus marinus ATCC 50983]|uniref:Uncharacterized protein n=1 Tax=Perkinsus marinus (strain ATCC 50983 / TXsc) TaxID=423536 RepID=C5KSF8_PERM5|nr:hypothetical protein Pmar_PMAR027390 [Perkinsus marinus ATCC 50983]EER12572.1 hypothetical protein Pmar_PMAR027390 [Perkinsus marinus ATCC 50983]|eukprot:XP_002780777.1 hypothetical protein Pmar_PMAR027390 [Perkinsus marinus ATCC 50983]
MLSASSHYSLTEVRLEFLMSFPDVVVAGDEILLLAPRGFSFSEIHGKEECRDYALISHEGVSPSTALDRSPPVCSANVISWTNLEGALFASVFYRKLLRDELLYRGSVVGFNDCNGDENVATLTTATNVLNAGQTIIDMVCVNPDATPIHNSCRLALYLDSNISHYCYIQIIEDGYEIKAMEAHVGLLTPPQCEEQIDTAGSAIKLQFSEMPIDQGIGFTVAIEIVNPGAPLTPDPDTGISNIIDANMAVPGTDLTNVPIIGSALAWDAVEAQSISKVQIVLKVSQDMQPEEVLEIHVEAPHDVAMTAPSNVVLSDNIPVSDVAPVSVAGNRLIIRLMRASLSLGQVTEVEGLREGTVIIDFSVKNPLQLPNANFWVVKMLGEDWLLVPISARF